MPKTVSIWLENDIHEELLDRCNKVGCRVSDFVKASVEFCLYGSVEFDFGHNWKNDDDTPKEASDKVPTVKLRLD